MARSHSGYCGQYWEYSKWLGHTVHLSSLSLLLLIPEGVAVLSVTAVSHHTPYYLKGYLIPVPGSPTPCKKCHYLLTTKRLVQIQFNFTTYINTVNMGTRVPIFTEIHRSTVNMGTRVPIFIVIYREYGDPGPHIHSNLP